MVILGLIKDGVANSTVLPGDKKTVARFPKNLPEIPSGYVKIAIENHHFQWVNPLFLWPFSIAILT